MRRIAITTVHALGALLSGWAIGGAVVLATSVTLSQIFLLGIHQWVAMLAGLTAGALLLWGGTRFYRGPLRWANWIMWITAALVIAGTFLAAGTR